MASQNVNILLSTFPGLSLPSTLSFALPSSSSVADLTDKIASYLPPSLPLNRLVLTTTSNKQLLPSSESIASYLISTNDNLATASILPLRLSAPLCGGKGGFGSQLRAAGGRMSSKRKRNQGDDNGSSRNLDGRRLRTVNEAKALAEYLALKPEMDKKEKEERRRRWQAVVEAAEKRQEELKNGGGKQKIDGQWMEDKDEMNEKAREAVLMAMKDGMWTDNLRDTILGGSSTSASPSEGSGQETPSSSEEESDDEQEMEDAPGPSSSEPARNAAPRRTFIAFLPRALQHPQTSPTMLPYLGRIIPRGRLPYHRAPLQISRLRRPCLRTTTAIFSPRPEVLARTQLRSFSTSIPLRASPAPEPTIEEAVLPVCCPGCGAYAQTVEPNEPGFYGKTRKQTRKLLSETKQVVEGEGIGEEESGLKAEGEKAADRIQKYLELTNVGGSVPRPKSADTAGKYLEKSKAPVQICDRCHDLLHHNKAVPAISPTMDSLRAYLDESPHKHNRIYHVVDAADFPMSVVKEIYDTLGIMDPRSKNRRSATYKYKSGKKLPTISFVINRSDLLAATKEQVDSKMEYVRSVLRDTFGLSHEEFRLGNVHMISAQRGWWTKKVKEEIREHGGGIWVIGKANVGKSSFIEACFPKDSRNLEKIAELIELREEESKIATHYDPSAIDSEGLLPPAPREDLYPILPVVSSLAGTTVSPIRIPFGRGRGEMIDLPGLERGELADHVRDEFKRDLIMTKRKKPERLSIKPGQSLLLGGGLVRITPMNPEDVVMAACFVPLESHLTRTEKAIEMQTEQRPYPKTNIAREGTGQVISSAGVFDLKWDVTHSHLPRSIAKAVEDGHMKMPSLPYKVMSTDVLIEGCGWVELTVQVRAKSAKESDSEDETSKSFPQVEVFTPYGRHVGSRPPIECWKFIEAKKVADNRAKGPRGRQNIGLEKRARLS
ncbi:hypothetical protein BO79DRAFT_227729 [Aspergillus costaricaensis CBS 115574]|uniref:Uncharacterized protein n=1 Tax=Aspergillus costaricaensis CBS 115574 TaxID=1448317 RepID=A0ACD1IFY2_9EURO|nr:hypothetical protein BO79DRAFT_227729 [Aspergillus costaricaensis CBS 115574]RAK89521.1 hypothetical protein BO79DRAFT_227729 [Aspergillus costaricaensis CBS 115574]